GRYERGDRLLLRVPGHGRAKKGSPREKGKGPVRHHSFNGFVGRGVSDVAATGAAFSQQPRASYMRLPAAAVLLLFAALPTTTLAQRAVAKLPVPRIAKVA